MTHATIQVASFDYIYIYFMAGLLNPRCRMFFFFSNLFFVVHVGRGIIHRVALLLFSSPRINFCETNRASHLRSPRKILVKVYRGMRQALAVVLGFILNPDPELFLL